VAACLNNLHDKVIEEEVTFQALCKNKEFVRQQQELMDQILAASSGKFEAWHVGEASVSSFDSDIAHYEGRPHQARLQLVDEDCHDERASRASVSPLDSDDDLLRFINDPSIMEEQRRIVDKIMSDRSCSPDSGHSDPPVESPSPYLSPLLSSLSSASSNFERSDEASMTSNSVSRRPSTSPRLEDETIRCIEQAAEQSKWMNQSDPKHQHAGYRCPSPRHAASTMHHAGHRRPSPRRAASTSSLEDKTNDTVIPRHEDSLIELYGGRKLQVRGTNHTWKCIAKGKATLVQCPVCFTILQVGSNAKLLYCTQCHEVSPIGLVVDSTMFDYRLDGKIAIVMQQQELEVAIAQKMAKNAR
jgi:hypothetical protein